MKDALNRDRGLKAFTSLSIFRLVISAAILLTVFLSQNEVAVNRSDSVVRKKAELQARGVKIPPELIGELETRYNAPAIRTGRMVLCLESPERNGELIPAFIVNGKRAAISPLHLVKNGSGKYEVWTDDEKYTDITLLPRPEFYDSTTGSGAPMYKLAVIVGPGHLRSVVNQRCHYHQIGKPCRFCAVQHWWDANIEKASSEIADTVAAGVREGVVKHVSLTTATLNTRGKGLEDLVETARLIQARVRKSPSCLNLNQSVIIPFSIPSLRKQDRRVSPPFPVISSALMRACARSDADEGQDSRSHVC